MDRLTFSNVPTAGGGVISGNIGIGAGSPFGEGGKYEAQVADIQKAIASAPAGTYDPKNWDEFLRKDYELPKGMNFIPYDDPELLSELQAIPSVQTALTGLYHLSLTQNQTFVKGSQERQKIWKDKEKQYHTTISLQVNRLMNERNAPILEAVKEQQRQLEIDQAVKIALEQKVRETATPTSTPTPTAPAVISSFPIIPIIIIAVIVGIFFLRRRA